MTPHPDDRAPVEFNLPPPNAGCDRAPVGQPMKIFTGKRYVVVERIMGDRYRAIDPITNEDLKCLEQLVRGELRAQDTPADQVDPTAPPRKIDVMEPAAADPFAARPQMEYVGTVLTARDQLAAAALQGLIPSDRRVRPEEMEATAVLAYQYADAMLRARK